MTSSSRARSVRPRGPLPMTSLSYTLVAILNQSIPPLVAKPLVIIDAIYSQDKVTNTLTKITHFLNILRKERTTSTEAQLEFTLKVEEKKG